MRIKNVHIFGGGTVNHVSSHFAVSAPAYGRTMHALYFECIKRFSECNVIREPTRMADAMASLETNEDIAARIEFLKIDPNTKVIFFSCALCDWKPRSMQQWLYTDCKHLDNGGNTHEFGKHVARLDSRQTAGVNVALSPADKVIKNIRTGRKDIFLVGFKTTCGATKQEMYEKGLALCKGSSCNLVLVNDVKTRWNMIVTPEEATYCETQDRAKVLSELVEMAYYRSQLTFTQSTVIAGDLVKWSDPRVPASLRTVVDHCIHGNAYKPFNGATVGHFAARLSDTEFLTSMRKSDFNKLNETGLVYVKTDGPDTVLAYGAKPSVGGQSQRIVFRDHPGFDCIAHFHCPLRPDAPDAVPVKSQRLVECGSHACGKQTSDGLAQFGNLKAVYLDNHGPNIVFPSSIDPQEVIDFIERNFDLSLKTGGYNLTPATA
jgi:hypothetical protein